MKAECVSVRCPLGLVLKWMGKDGDEKKRWGRKGGERAFLYRPGWAGRKPGTKLHLRSNTPPPCASHLALQTPVSTARCTILSKDHLREWKSHFQIGSTYNHVFHPPSLHSDSIYPYSDSLQVVKDALCQKLYLNLSLSSFFFPLPPLAFFSSSAFTLHIPFAGCYLEQWFHLLQKTVAHLFWVWGVERESVVILSAISIIFYYY